MQKQDSYKLCLLMTGSELMSGDTIDSNSAFLGQVFNDIGVEVAEKVTVGDDSALLAEQLKRLAQRYDIILMNGGLGPTQDDLTAQVLAKVTNTPIARHQQAEQHVLQWCHARGLDVNPANLKQADLPANAQIFTDAPGSAVAFYLPLGEALVIATPGVSSELRQIIQRDILPFLQQRYNLKQATPWQQYQLFGIGESSLQQLLNEEFPTISEDYTIGFRANFPYLELKFKPHHTNSNTAQLNKLLSQLETYIIGPAHTNAASATVAALKEKQKTLSTAESCTGGLIASDITRIPGCSAVFPGSIVSYSNTAKEQLLHVDPNLIQSHGAVSEAVAKAMLKGLLHTLQSDYGIAVTGIAGPEGGSEEKPVGTVWIAWGSLESMHTVQLCITQPRKQFQNLVSTIALDLIRRQLLDLPTRPYYLSRWQAKI